jgi:hypothetical protein
VSFLDTVEKGISRLHVEKSNIRTKESRQEKSANQLTPWSRVFLQKPPVAHLLKNFPTLYGTQRFITMLTVPGLSHPISQRSIFFITLPPTSSFSCDLFFFDFVPKPLYLFLYSPMHATCLARLILLGFILIIFGEEFKLEISSCSFLLPFHPS